MTYMRTIGSGLVAGALALSLASCGDSKDKQEQAAQEAVAESALLAYAPANTPYVFTNSRPFPRSITEKLLVNTNDDLAQADKQLQQAMETAEFDTPEEKQMMVLLQAISAELQGKMSADGLASLGLLIDGRSLVYGMGVLPVLRTEIGDAQKVQDFIARIEQRSGMSAPQKKLGEQSYHRFELEQLVGIMAVTDEYFIAALLPAKAEADLLPLVLGETMPSPSLADNDAFKQLIKDNGYLGYGEGYIDLVKFTEMALGESQGVNALIFSALDGAPAELSPQCSKMVKSLVQSVPRITGGFTEMSDSGYSLEAVIETSSDIAARLQKIASPVPGLGIDNGAMLSLGLALNLPELRDALKSGMMSVLEQGKGCEMVDEQEITKSMQGLDMMFNPMVTGLKGFNLQVNDMVFDPQNITPKSVDAQLLLAADDPRSVTGLLGLLDPSFTQLQIPGDGTPVTLPLDALSPDAPVTHIAIKDRALVVSTGGDATSKSAAAFIAALASPAPIFALNYNGAKLLERLSAVEPQIMQNIGGDEDMLAGYEGFKESSKIYGPISVQVAGSAKGLVINQKVILQ